MEVALIMDRNAGTTTSLLGVLFGLVIRWVKGENNSECAPEEYFDTVHSECRSCKRPCEISAALCKYYECEGYLDRLKMTRPPPTPTNDDQELDKWGSSVSINIEATSSTPLPNQSPSNTMSAVISHDGSIATYVFGSIIVVLLILIIIILIRKGKMQFLCRVLSQGIMNLRRCIGTNDEAITRKRTDSGLEEMTGSVEEESTDGTDSNKTTSEEKRPMISKDLSQTSTYKDAMIRFWEEEEENTSPGRPRRHYDLYVNRTRLRDVLVRRGKIRYDEPGFNFLGVLEKKDAFQRGKKGGLKVLAEALEEMGEHEKAEEVINIKYYDFVEEVSKSRAARK